MSATQTQTPSKLSSMERVQTLSPYLQGVSWAILACLISNANDILMRILGSRLDSMEVVFFRFLMGMLILLPFMLRQKGSFKTTRPFVHVTRSLLGFLAVAGWGYAVTSIHLTAVTTISFTVPLFVLPLAIIFLKEKVGLQRALATLIGFIGILVVVNPKGFSLEPAMIILLCSALMFATLDIIAKKMVMQESMLAMLFYFSAGTSLAGLIPAILVWKTPTTLELILLICLGVGANLIQYCLLKAFRATEVSALAPYRYVELIFSSIFGYLLFQEIPTSATLIGALIIIPSTLYIAYYENKKSKQQS